MRPEDLKALLDKRPFEPFRFHMTTGQAVEVRHPEMAAITRSSVIVYSHTASGIIDKFVFYTLIHIVRVEPVSPGQRKGRRRKAA